MRPAKARSFAGAAAIAIALIASPVLGQDPEVQPPEPPDTTAPFAEDAEVNPVEPAPPALEEEADVGPAEQLAPPVEEEAEIDPAEPVDPFVGEDAEVEPAEPVDSLVEEDTEVEPAQPTAEAAGPVNANPLSTLDLESLTATRELPLFTPSRTPPTVMEEPPEPEPEPVVEPEIVEETDPEPPTAELIGIVVTEAEQVVLLMDQTSGEVQRIRPGEDFEGWTVSIIDSRTVELESDGNFQTLTMFTETGDPADPTGNLQDELDSEMWDDGSEIEEFDGSPDADEESVEEESFDEGFDDETSGDATSEDESFEDESFGEEETNSEF